MHSSGRISCQARHPKVATIYTTPLKQECIPVGCIPSAAVAVSPAKHATRHHAHLHHTHPLPRTLPTSDTHAPTQPCMPSHHCHACPLPCMPPPTMHTQPPITHASPPPMNRILDTCFWKLYLSATSFADGNDGVDVIYVWVSRVTVMVVAQRETLNIYLSQEAIHNNFLVSLCL